MVFKKGTKVVLVINGAGFKTASVGHVVKSLSKGVVRLEDSSLEFDTQGMERRPAIAGFYAEIIAEES